MGPNSQPQQNEPGSSSLPTAIQQILEPLQQNKMGPPRMQGPGPGMGQGAGLLGAGKCTWLRNTCYVHGCYDTQWSAIAYNQSDLTLLAIRIRSVPCSWSALQHSNEQSSCHTVWEITVDFCLICHRQYNSSFPSALL